MVPVASGGQSSAGSAPALDGLSRAEKLAFLRRHIAELPGKATDVISHESAGGAAAQPPPEWGARKVLPLLEPFAGLLPAGGIVAGSVVSVSGAGVLLLTLLAAVTAAGGYVAVVAQPDLGLLAAAEMGADLRRLAIIADPGADALEVAAVLLDGMDLVVLGNGALARGSEARGAASGGLAAVSPARAQVLASRARSKGAVLVVVAGVRWPGVDLRFEASVAGYVGIGRGHGRLRCLVLAVRVWGRSFPPRHGRVRLRSFQGGLRMERVEAPGAAAGLAR